MRTSWMVSAACVSLCVCGGGGGRGEMVVRMCTLHPAQPSTAGIHEVQAKKKANLAYYA